MHVREPVIAVGVQHLIDVERERGLALLNVSLRILPHLHALDVARVLETRVAADPLVSRAKVVRRVKNDGFVVMYVGIWENHLCKRTTRRRRP